MLNNFCFDVFAQKWVFVIMSHVTCYMSHVTCDMSYVKCLCWSLGHAEQLLFLGLCSKVSISNYVTCDMSHFACHMSHCACHMSYIKCLCWFLGHAEQLLFWSLCSKVSICKGVRLYAELGINMHNFFVFLIWMMQFGTESANGCFWMVLKGFFANINMTPKIKVNGSQGVVELFTE